MKITYLILLFLSIASCRDLRHKKYELIINSATKFEMLNDLGQNIMIFDKKEVEGLKLILLRNIEPESIQHISTHTRITIYKDSIIVGSLAIGSIGETPYANFDSPGLHFGFPSTYGIGMTVDNLTEGSSSN